MSFAFGFYSGVRNLIKLIIPGSPYLHLVSIKTKQTRNGEAIKLQNVLQKSVGEGTYLNL